MTSAYHHSPTILASALPITNGTYFIHSSARILCPPPQPADSLLDMLNSHSHKHLFQHLTVDNDGQWILPAARAGSLILVHDGSYMPHLNNVLCSAAVVILCTTTKQMGTVHICEKTNSNTASNYRGEILGGIIASTILNAIDKLNPTSEGSVTCFCDNLGVIHHANNLSRSLPETQTQMDALLSFRRQLGLVRMPWEYRHVQSHQDATHSIQDLTIPQRLNVLADALAKNALVTANGTNQSSKPDYPGENVRIFVSGHKITSSIKSALYTSWGRRVAQTLYDKRRIIRSRHFDLVDWENVDRTMQSLPKMYQVWITKHVSGFCGTNKLLSRILPNTSNRCQCCGTPDETPSHITRCSNPGRVQMFDATVTSLIHWMTATTGHPLLIQAIQIYLTNRGKLRMMQICADSPTLQSFATDHDKLGWENFMTGRICSSLFRLQRTYLQQSRSPQAISSWACQFTQHVLHITHQQWLYRNARIHIRVLENMTAPEHHAIRDTVLALLHTDPDDLLPQHQYLLLDQDFHQLGSGTTLDRQHWIAHMNSALAAAKHTGHKRARDGPVALQHNKHPRF